MTINERLRRMPTRQPEPRISVKADTSKARAELRKLADAVKPKKEKRQ